MKRKRIRCEEKEEKDVVGLKEEEEEFLIRRTSLRGKKRPRYADNVNDDEDEESEEVSEEDSDEDSEEDSDEESDEESELKPVPGRAGLLPVTCGSGKGVMDVAKLQRGEECIQCEGGFLTPTEFEAFGGRGCSKRWKSTIFHNKKPLQFWLKKGRLSTRGYNQRGRAAAAELSHSGNSSEDPSALRAHLVPVSKEHPGTAGTSGTAGTAGTEEEDEEDKAWLLKVAVGSPGSKETASPLKDVRVIVKRLQQNGDHPREDRDDPREDRDDPREDRDDPREDREDRDHPRGDRDDPREDRDDPREDRDGPVNMKTAREHLTQNSDREEPQREPTPPAAKPSSSPVDIQTETVDRPGSGMGSSDIGGNLHSVTEVSSSDLQPEPSIPPATRSSDVDESHSSDAVDLRRLNKEKIQLQLKVLKLQEQYYSLKIRGLQN